MIFLVFTRSIPGSRKLSPAAMRATATLDRDRCGGHALDQIGHEKEWRE